MRGADAAGLRAQFPVLERVAYLNAGSAGPLPASAVAAGRAELERQGAEGRSTAHFQTREELQERQRTAYARLLGVAPEEVALTTGTSEGIARVLAGMQLRRGDEVVTSDEEHPGVLGPLRAARDLRGAAVRQVPFAELASAVRSETRLVVCSHVSWITGAVAPAELADVEVPVVLDGAQAVGAIPLDVRPLRAAAYAGSGQKWLCGPDGSGMLHVSAALAERVAATMPGYVSFEDANVGIDAVMRRVARRHESGALPAEGSAIALASLAVLERSGWEAVHARARELAERLADKLGNRGHEVRPRGATTLVSWRCDDAAAVRNRLAEAGVVVRDLPGRGLLRASVGAWNDESDLERLLDALPAPER